MNADRSRLVNAITFARVPLVLLWAALAVVHEFSGGWPLAVLACAAMLLSGLTDLWDGRLARKWKVVSTLGKMADPLMDKVFYIIAFPTLTWQAMHAGEPAVHALILLAFTILYMLRDTWVTFLRAIGAMFGADVAAMWLGKVRTALSFPGAGWVYVFLAFSRYVPPEHAAWVGCWRASCYLVEGVLAVLTLWSLVTYTCAYRPYVEKALSK